MFISKVARLSTLIASFMLTASALTEGCEKAVSLIEFPTDDMMSACSLLPDYVSPIYDITSMSGNHSEFLGNYSRALQRHWEKMCSQDCISTLNSVFRNIGSECGPDVMLNVTINDQEQQLRALDALEANVVAQKLVCVEVEEKLCMFSAYNLVEENCSNDNFTCSECNRMLYSSKLALEDESYFAVRPYIQPWLEIITGALNNASSECPDTFFQDLPDPPFFIVPSSAWSIFESLKMALLINFLVFAISF